MKAQLREVYAKTMSKSPKILNNFRGQPFALLAVGLLSLLLAILCFIPHPLALLAGYGHFFLLGVIGAVVANVTGAGGGVVFIPAFTSLGVAGIQALGTSLAIQSFGMTAGSISWLMAAHRHQHGGKDTVALTYHLLIIAGTAAVAGMLSAQYLLPPPGWPVATLFKYFSVLFGAILLLVTIRKNRHRHTLYRVRRRHVPLIILVCYSGGLITSWISVGAGEWLAILLFFLGYPTLVIITAAVVISSMTVLSGLPYHLLIADSISWKILLFAAPAAILGGFIARLLAERLGPVRLKIFFAAWILATGLAM